MREAAASAEERARLAVAACTLGVEVVEACWEVAAERGVPAVNGKRGRRTLENSFFHRRQAKTQRSGPSPTQKRQQTWRRQEEGRSATKKRSQQSRPKRDEPVATAQAETAGSAAGADAPARVQRASGVAMASNEERTRMRNGRGGASDRHGGAASDRQSKGSSGTSKGIKAESCKKEVKKEADEDTAVLQAGPKRRRSGKEARQA